MNQRQSYTRAVKAGINRRSFLGLTSGVAGAFALGAAGCGARPGESTDAAQINIPDTGAKLPGEAVTLRWMDTGDAKKAFWNQFWPKYMQKHPNITVKYDGIPGPDINEVLPLAFRNKTAPDVFSLTALFVPANVVQSGWVAPLDDALPNFDTWKAAFPANTLIDGIHVFDGKTYSFPVASNKRYENLLLTNTEMLKRADIDLGDTVPSWNEVRDAAKKITKAGNGRFYGLVLNGEPAGLENLILALAHVAGQPNVGGLGFGINPLTGKYVYTSDEVLAALDLLRAIDDDGSILPGWHSIKGNDGGPRVPRGDAGMMLSGWSGPWIPALWEQQDRSFDYGAYPAPVPDGVDPLPLRANAADLGNSFWLSANSKVKEVAGDIFSYIGSAEGQTRWGHFAGISNPSVFPDALKSMRERATPGGRKVLEIGESMVLAPAPVLGNPAISKVAANLKLPSPTFAETLAGVVIGEIADAKKALKDVQDRTERALDAAFAAAKKQGAEASRDDLTFGNWDPRKDYTKADYAARKNK